MISHIFKLIWNKKKSHFLMMLEIFVSFLILFVLWSLSVYFGRNYWTPSGINPERVWAAYLEFNAPGDSLNDIYKESVRQRLKDFKEVERFAFTTSHIPYGFNTWNESVTHKGKNTMAYMFAVDPAYPDVLEMQVRSGRWVKPEDTIGAYTPIVINQALARELFGDESPVGQVLEDDEAGRKRKVMGVVDYFRYKSSFQADEPAIFTLDNSGSTMLLLKMHPEANADTEAKLAKALQAGKDWTLEIQHMETMKSNQNRLTLAPILLLFIVCGFLVFNVVLGLFGVLFQHISRRKNEIGLRRALGATRMSVWRHFVGETLAVATFGILIGVFFAVQVPLLKVFDVESSVYIWGIILAAVSIYILAILCAFYPSRQAADLHPASALREN